ncbi:hypothetical protein SAMN05216386_0747 [Nitrosospira briensis]|uniref:Uncharacterized protein n=1 Tax=Nitrosospira briensis TaxID=35799 RepID=A0A1I4YKH2_9PROT|nr:hypothetical protein SAMN05216386_0747 [Nitrosospira briensis]
MQPMKDEKCNGLNRAFQRSVSLALRDVDGLQAPDAFFPGIAAGITPSLRIPLENAGFTIGRHQYALRHTLFTDELLQFFPR